MIPSPFRAALFAACLAAYSVPAQPTWIPRNPLPTPNDLNGMTAHGGLAVAVGDAGTIVTTGDGKTWIVRASGTRENLGGVAWTGDGFMAVGAGGAMTTSPDGLAWTAAASLKDAGILLTIAAGGGKRVIASAFPAAIFASADGKAWTRTDLDSLDWMNAFAWSGSKWIAVGENGSVMASADGLAWTPAPSFTSRDIRSVAWTGSLFLAAPGDCDSIYSSPDGAAWTPRFLPPGGGAEVQDVIWTGKEAIAIGAWPVNTWASPDGLTWAVRDTVSGTYHQAVAVLGEGLVAVGQDGRLAHSPNGAGWTSASTDMRGDFEKVAWGKDRFIAASLHAGVFSSRDGIKWEKTAVALDGIGTVAYGNGQWVIAGRQGKLLTSPDGVAWTQRASGTKDWIETLAWIGDRWVGAGSYDDDGTGGGGTHYRLISSRDGIVWEAEAERVGEIRDLAWNGSRLVAVGSSDNILSSGDSALHLVPRYKDPERRGLSGVAWAGDRFVAVGPGIALASKDGIAWKEFPLNGDVRLRAPFWDGSRVLAVGGRGSFAVSPEGETWTYGFSGTGNSLTGLAFDGSTYVAVGAGGTILTASREGSGIRALRPRQARPRGTGFPLFARPGRAEKRGADGRSRASLTLADRKPQNR